MIMSVSDCELCRDSGGELLWQNDFCRIVRVADPRFPGFCRVIWHAHVREMSDLDGSSQLMLMRIVLTVENTIRQLFSPDKINLASFGNVVPHLHWHIIPRWQDDPFFPEPIWGQQRREESVARPRPQVDTKTLANALTQALQ